LEVDDIWQQQPDSHLEPDDIADAIAYIVTRPRRVAVNEMLVRPTEQDF
jgi:NADP-dependent 3-hydroxy acid dehydrogenase YdfG